MTKAEAHRLAKLAKALDFAHEPVRDALAAGGLLVDQAQVIIDAVDALPDDLVSAEVAPTYAMNDAGGGEVSFHRRT